MMIRTRRRGVRPLQGRSILCIFRVTRWASAPLEREVLELFCSQSSIYIERLHTARSDKDWKDAAHSLKGSATAIGAWRTAAAAANAEALSSEASSEARAVRLREIESSVREAESYIGTLLEDR